MYGASVNRYIFCICRINSILDHYVLGCICSGVDLSFQSVRYGITNGYFGLVCLLADGHSAFNRIICFNLYGFFVLSSVHVVTGYGSDVLEGPAFQGIIFYLNIICDFHDLSRLHILAGFQCESCRADAYVCTMELRVIQIASEGIFHDLKMLEQVCIQGISDDYVLSCFLTGINSC